MSNFDKFKQGGDSRWAQVAFDLATPRSGPTKRITTTMTAMQVSCAQLRQEQAEKYRLLHYCAVADSYDFNPCEQCAPECVSLNGMSCVQNEDAEVKVHQCSAYKETLLDFIESIKTQETKESDMNESFDKTVFGELKKQCKHACVTKYVQCESTAMNGFLLANALCAPKDMSDQFTSKQYTNLSLVPVQVGDLVLALVRPMTNTSLALARVVKVLDTSEATEAYVTSATSGFVLTTIDISSIQNMMEKKEQQLKLKGQIEEQVKLAKEQVSLKLLFEANPALEAMAKDWQEKYPNIPLDINALL